ncbi:hypothetical protein K443DRAFT_131621 [Laccaria amethystina LaAM-08-1]|uniref:C2H2-type domain-containing protein n=1 Tax=Laccaria amethystina LaAM-08-1 TaxID=1095629 RepID=A0A0C9Y4J3_9AGAR|nr:hypothetical protein K443DRAFT_131621 [Laccaria amethystina LaAM-08-1]
MAHTTYPTPRFRAVRSLDLSLLQTSAPDPQLSGTPRSVSPAHRRYSSFSHLSTPFTDFAVLSAATEQPASNDHPASYQQLNFFEGQHGCASQVEDSPSILFGTSYEVSLVSEQSHADGGYTQCPTRSQKRASVKSSSSFYGSSNAKAASSPLPKRRKRKACCGAMSGSRWKAQDPDNRFVVCKYGERVGGPTCGAIIKVFHCRRTQLQNHLYDVHWDGDKTGIAECLWGPPNHACLCEVPINKEGMARHILDTPHSFGDRDDQSATKIVFNKFFCRHCGKSFGRSDSMARHVNVNRNKDVVWKVAMEVLEFRDIAHTAHEKEPPRLSSG